MTIELEGKLRLGDEYRSDPNLDPGAIYLDTQDLVRILDNADLDGKYVIIDVNDGERTWEGVLTVSQGYGDLDWGPAEPDVLEVDGEDIISTLYLFAEDSVQIEIEHVPSAR